MAELSVLRLSIDEAGGAVRVCVRETDFDGARRRTYTIPYEEYARLGSPAVGEPIDEETAAALAEAEGRMKATEKAVSLLSYGDNSCRALCRKLRAKGYDRETAEAAVARMLQKGYIREEEQARRLAVACATRKLWGKRRIVAHLAEKGYDISLAHRVIDEAVEEGEIDFAETAAELLSRKLDANAPTLEKRKLLYRYGY